MSSIQGYFGQRTVIPTVYDSNPGLAFGNGDDFLSPRSISNIGSGFSRSVTPTYSNSPYFGGNQYPFSHNASPNEILLRSINYTSQVAPTTGNNPAGLVRLPNVPYPYYQNVPDMGINPNAMHALSATTQFQGELQTVGPQAIPGYPVINFGQNPSALDIMGRTDSFINATVPYHPTRRGQSVYYPSTQGGVYYPPPPIQPPFWNNPFMSQRYPHFSPYFGSGVVPSQIPYPASPFGGCFPQPYPQPQPQPQGTTSDLVALVRSSLVELPGFIPRSIQGGILNFFRSFNLMPEGARVQIRQTLNNPTTADANILNSTGITNTGGKYNQGVVNNPFLQAGFLTDTNPYAQYQSGMVVTNGNGNGKVLGTTERDILIGAQARSNIVNGRGGEDDIVTGATQDMINVSQGDRVSADAGDDLTFFDFSTPNVNTLRQTVVDGGDGNDTMVLTIGGNPSQTADSPTFTRLANGLLSVSLNGIQLLTQSIERFIVVDKQGNIGGVYQPTQS